MRRRDFLKAPALGVLLPGAVGLEHVYPFHGPPGLSNRSNDDATKFTQRLHQDFATYVPGIEYFLLGNGDIQAVFQYCPERSGEHPQTFLGLTLMDADRFARKWSTFLFHPERGIERTMIWVNVNGKGFSPNAETFQKVFWKYDETVPVVSLVWTAGPCEIEEEFFVPNEGSLLFRHVHLKNTSGQAAEVRVGLSMVPNFCLFDEIGTDDKERTVNAHGFATMKLQCLDRNVTTSGRYDLNVALGEIKAGETRLTRFVYSLDGGEEILRERGAEKVWSQTVGYWSGKVRVSTGNDGLDHLYAISRTGLKAHVSRDGKRDSGYWMYNMEWVRDDVMVAVGMLHAGLNDEAKSILTKILERSVGADGRTIESSRWFGYDYTELDQNGQVLFGVWSYLCWTGDLAFVKKYWNKITLAADFPLQDVFWDKASRLLHNKREFWERSDSFGVEDGFELVYQFWVVLGLEKAAEMAELLGEAKSAKRWHDAAAEIKSAMLNDPKFKLIEDGHLIKRRTRDGRWQQFMIPPNRSSMPPGSPIATEDQPACDPDSAEVYPILHGMVDPKNELARNTLQWVEQLWNQRWDFGGYSRYNVSSEPDPPAPWPLAAILISQANAEAGNSEKVWRAVHWLNSIHGGRSGGWFERYGPSITPPAPPVCVIGWAWAEVAALVVRHLMGVRPGLKNLAIRPILLDGIDEMRGNFKIRRSDYDIALFRAKEKPVAIVNGREMALANGALTLPYPKGATKVKIEMHV